MTSADIPEYAAREHDRDWRGWQIALLAVVLALLFLGTRGLWDPDEGRYSNVALIMLDTGDWLMPHRTTDIGHWTKPPLTYWAIAASVGVFGLKAWAVRLPSALAYLFCVWLVRQMGTRLVPGRANQPALVFATMFMPVGASQLITTDFLLTAWETLAVCGFVCARFGAPSTRARRGWWLLMWLGFGLGFLTKGPPALLPAMGLVAFSLWVRRSDAERPRDAWIHAVGFALFAAVALPWYIVVTQRVPGLLGYFTGQEVVARVTSDIHRRNGEWYGWLVVYAPTLLLGTLPWTLDVLRWAARLPRQLRAWWDDRGSHEREAADVLLALWILLPLLVFCLSRSRLPLYVLPLFPALALAVMRVRIARGAAMWHWAWILLIAIAWKSVVFLVPSSNDGAPFAQLLQQRAGATPVRKVLFIDDTERYALHLYLGLPARIEQVVTAPEPQPRFNADYDRTAVDALRMSRGDPQVIWVTKRKHWPQIQGWMQQQDARPVLLGEPFAAYSEHLGKDGQPRPDEARVAFRVE